MPSAIFLPKPVYIIVDQFEELLRMLSKTCGFLPPASNSSDSVIPFSCDSGTQGTSPFALHSDHGKPPHPNKTRGKCVVGIDRFEGSQSPAFFHASHMTEGVRKDEQSPINQRHISMNLKLL